MPPPESLASFRSARGYLPCGPPTHQTNSGAITAKKLANFIAAIAVERLAAVIVVAARSPVGRLSHASAR